eukprot:TRINITY_DN14831_c1_g3_i3.p1 TRINITY_DN14831_c1_g3~~TRINITY_DN14831_c1_g3_i3.p1  ORF type:complete len:1301 (+),score=140.24 TRINITY_DN14831_c1_g3_i3:307-3903(+)
MEVSFIFHQLQVCDQDISYYKLACPYLMYKTSELRLLLNRFFEENEPVCSSQELLSYTYFKLQNFKNALSAIKDHKHKLYEQQEGIGLLVTQEKSLRDMKVSKELDDFCRKIYKESELLNNEPENLKEKALFRYLEEQLVPSDEIYQHLSRAFGEEIARMEKNGHQENSPVPYQLEFATFNYYKDNKRKEEAATERTLDKQPKPKVDKKSKQSSTASEHQGIKPTEIKGQHLSAIKNTSSKGGSDKKIDKATVDSVEDTCYKQSSSNREFNKDKVFTSSFQPGNNHFLTVQPNISQICKKQSATEKEQQNPTKQQNRQYQQQQSQSTAKKQNVSEISYNSNKGNKQERLQAEKEMKPQPKQLKKQEKPEKEWQRIAEELIREEEEERKRKEKARELEEERQRQEKKSKKSKNKKGKKQKYQKTSKDKAKTVEQGGTEHVDVVDAEFVNEVVSSISCTGYFNVLQEPQSPRTPDNKQITEENKEMQQDLLQSQNTVSLAAATEQLPSQKIRQKQVVQSYLPPELGPNDEFDEISTQLPSNKVEEEAPSRYEIQLRSNTKDKLPGTEKLECWKTVENSPMFSGKTTLQNSQFLSQQSRILEVQDPVQGLTKQQSTLLPPTARPLIAPDHKPTELEYFLKISTDQNQLDSSLFDSCRASYEQLSSVDNVLDSLINFDSLTSGSRANDQRLQKQVANSMGAFISSCSTKPGQQTKEQKKRPCLKTLLPKCQDEDHYLPDMDDLLPKVQTADSDLPDFDALLPQVQEAIPAKQQQPANSKYRAPYQHDTFIQQYEPNQHTSANNTNYNNSTTPQNVGSSRIAAPNLPLSLYNNRSNPQDNQRVQEVFSALLDNLSTKQQTSNHADSNACIESALRSSLESSNFSSFSDQTSSANDSNMNHVLLGQNSELLSSFQNRNPYQSQQNQEIVNNIVSQLEAVKHKNETQKQQTFHQKVGNKKSKKVKKLSSQNIETPTRQNQPKLDKSTKLTQYQQWLKSKGQPKQSQSSQSAQFRVQGLFNAKNSSQNQPPMSSSNAGQFNSYTNPNIRLPQVSYKSQLLKSTENVRAPNGLGVNASHIDRQQLQQQQRRKMVAPPNFSQHVRNAQTAWQKFQNNAKNNAKINSQLLQQLKADEGWGLDSEEEEGQCPVCLENDSDVVFHPCQHEFCFACAKAVRNRSNQCPLCRGNIEGECMIAQVPSRGEVVCS